MTKKQFTVTFLNGRYDQLERLQKYLKVKSKLKEIHKALNLLEVVITGKIIKI